MNYNSEYSQSYLENLIKNQIEENINLDFKSGLTLKNEDKVINEKEHKAHEFSFIDGNIITKEWLEQVINSRIQRKIPNISIVPVRFDNDLKRTIYLVDIPRSSQVPHMTSEKRYNFESTEMEEYEIRNLYLSVERKNLMLYEPTLLLGDHSRSMGKLLSQNIIVEFNIENIGLAIEDRFKLEVFVPESLAKYGYSSGANLSTIFHHVRNEGIYSVFSIPNESPIFQNEKMTIWNLEVILTCNNFKDAEKFPIKYKLYYSNDLISKECFLIEEINKNNKMLLLEDFTLRCD